jgi:putative glutamine amidotransferase
LHGNPAVRTAKAHALHIEPGSWLHQTVGATVIPINSLHNQGIDRLAPGLIAEASAPDGTIEAVRWPGRSFAIGVQWHPEYDWQHDAASRAIFMAFRDAVRTHASRVFASAAD